MEKRYSLRNAAEMLGIKVRTARQWVRDGKLRATKYPGSQRWFVTESELERLLGKEGK